MTRDDTQPCRTHDWQPTHDGNAYACTRCEATAQPCRTCGKPLEHASSRTCDKCVSDARNLVRDIRDLYRRLPDVIAGIAGLHAIRYDHAGSAKPQKGGKGTATTIIGGSAFVMAGPGNADKSRLGPGEDPQSEVIRSLMAAEQHDPPSVLGVLTFWEDTWRQEQHQAAATSTSVTEATEYLVHTTTWAAQHSPTWDEYLTDLHGLRGRMRNLTGDSQPPVKAGVPCPYCSGQIVQTWTGKGRSLSDIRECDGCHLTWASEAHFRMALREAHQALPDTHPEQLVTIDDAKRVYKPRGVRPNLLDLWVHRGLLLPARTTDGRERRDVRGALLYRLGDIADRLTPMEGSAS